jgi:hypothetical protein
MKSPIDILQDKIIHCEQIIQNCNAYLPEAKDEVKRLEMSLEEAKISILLLKNAIAKLEN